MDYRVLTRHRLQRTCVCASHTDVASSEDRTGFQNGQRIGPKILPGICFKKKREGFLETVASTVTRHQRICTLFRFDLYFWEMLLVTDLQHFGLTFAWLFATFTTLHNITHAAIGPIVLMNPEQHYHHFELSWLLQEQEKKNLHDGKTLDQTALLVKSLDTPSYAMFTTSNLQIDDNRQDACNHAVKKTAAFGETININEIFYSFVYNMYVHEYIWCFQWETTMSTVMKVIIGCPNFWLVVHFCQSLLLPCRSQQRGSNEVSGKHYRAQ